MAKKYKLTQDGPEVQALLNKIDGIRANQTQEQGVEPIQMENLSLDGVLYAFLTSAVSNLLYYYTKSETYSKSEVDALVAAIKQFTIQSVDALPQPPSADTMNILYLVPAEEPKVANEKDEFITVIKDGSYAWEQVGSTAVDLSGYVTTEALNTTLAGYVTSGALETALAGKQDNINDLQTIRDGAAAGATAYQKPSTGIPASDLATGVIPTIPTDMVKYTAQTLTDAQKAQARTNIGAGTYTKPSSGIPAGDLASGVIPDVSQFITRSVNDLANYYLKSEVYTKDEVASLIGAIQQFHYEIAASISAVTNPSNNVLYLIGPTGSGADKYEEYVYDTTKPVAERWVKIGDTSIDLSGYVTTTALNTALADYTATSSLAAVALSGSYNDLLNKPTIPSPKIYIGTCTTAAATAAKEATVETFPLDANNKPLVGTVVGIKFNYTNSAVSATLNVNSTGDASIWYDAAAYTGSGSYAGVANRYLYFVWDGTYWAFLSWGYDKDADTNTVGYNLRINGLALPFKSKTYRYRLMFASPDNKTLVPANTSTSTSATASKTVNQDKINPFGIIWYYSYTSAINAGSTTTAARLWYQYGGISLGYSFNRTGAALEMTAKDPVYLKCAPQTDGSAIMDDTTPIVHALPSTADGKIYILLGYAESETAITLIYKHPVYYHDGTGIRLWTGKEASGGGGETKTLILNGTSSAYFDKADVMNVVNDALFFFTLEVFTDIDPEYKVGTAIFVGSDNGGTNFELRYKDGTNILSQIIKFIKNTTTGDVTSLVFDGNTYNYNSATDRYELQTS